MSLVSKYKTFGKNRSLRLKDFNYSQPYVIYFITICTKDRKEYFKDKDISNSVINSLKEYSIASKYRLISFCLMPDHIHFLIQSEENGKDLREFIRDFKKFTTHQSWKLGIKGKLWQRGYYEHILRNKQDINRISEYILNNPVRKGLVENQQDYLFSRLLHDPI